MMKHGRVTYTASSRGAAIRMLVGGQLMMGLLLALGCSSPVDESAAATVVAEALEAPQQHLALGRNGPGRRGRVFATAGDSRAS